MIKISKHLLLLLFLFTSYSCKKEVKESYYSKKKYDSLNYYLNKIKKEPHQTTKKKLINKAFNLVFNVDYNHKTRDTLFNIVMLHYKEKNWSDFNKCNNKLLSKAIEEKDTTNIGRCYRYKGAYYKNNTDKIDSAFYYYTKAEKTYRNYDKNEYANILLNKGIIQCNIEDYLGAELSLLKGYNILKKTENYIKTYETLNQLCVTYAELKEYEKAKEYCKLALDLSNSKLDNDENYTSICLNNLGYIYLSNNDFIKAKEVFKEALKDKKLKYNRELYSNLIDNLGYSKFKSSEYDKLPQMFYESLKIRDSLQFFSSVVISKIHLSEYYLKKKDTVLSTNFSSEALKIAKTTKNPSIIVLALKNASIVDNKNATKYNDEYIKINDSLQMVERNNKDRFARIEFETDELRQANTQLSEQNRDILNYFAIAIVFGGFLFFARFQRLKARELALKQTQQQANEEIYRLIISHQNQLEEGRDLEKKRISKELHDGVLGRLFGLRLNLDGLNNFDDEETKQQRLEYLNELKLIEQDLREISHELSRENLVLINNFVAIINNLLEQQSKINKAKINTLISDKIDWENVSNTIKINLYRILQEALQNINKHAEASKINIIFNKDPKGNLIFSVEDNGKGYNTNGKKTKGIGMDNIVDRVHQCQGKIDIKSQIGKGTKIIITFPLENETINM